MQVWSTSQTFTHGYLVFPIFLWLVWRKRETLVALNSAPEWRAVPLVAFFGICWLISGLAGIQVGEHAAFVLMLMCTIWATVGSSITKAIQFPVLFLFFLAPVGQELVPYLMEFTADLTVWAIRISGIPIFREGLFFSLPSGNWSVVEACSGINYLISSISLGSLYAYLSYSCNKTRIIFMLIAAVLPIIANSVRAYIIVMLGHFSDNKIATGVDHLIYGWLFFGIVMFLLFSIGRMIQNSANDNSKPQPLTPQNVPVNNESLRQRLLLLVTVCIVAGAWPVWANYIGSGETRLPENASFASDLLPRSTQSIGTLSSTATQWQPHMSGHDIRLDVEYDFSESQSVRAMAFVYGDQYQGKEMISSSNVLVRSQDEDWRSAGSSHKRITSSSGVEIQFVETRLRSNKERLVVWHWYKIGEHTTSNPIFVKVQELLGKLTLDKSLSTTYMLVTKETPTSYSALTAAIEIIMSGSTNELAK